MMFEEIKILDYFSLNDEFGTAEFMKTGEHDSICIASNDGTYEKARNYYFQLDTICNET